MKSKTYACFSDAETKKKSFKIKDMQIGLQAVDEQLPLAGVCSRGRRLAPDVSGSDNSGPA
jgi:hypothetical protein